MGKRLTVAELSQQLESSHVSYQKLEADTASLRAQLEAVLAKISAVPTTTVADATVRALRPDITCPKCSGTGFYDQSIGAICFQCDGDGVQNDAQQRRNWGYRANNGPARSAISKSNGCANAKPTYAKSAPSADVLAYRERAAAAKAAAIAGGVAVLV